jgi:single-stranded-DNA-specific exonuclease
MIIKSNRWDIKPKPDPADIKRLIETFGISEITAGLLCNRNLTKISETEAFLNPSWESLRDSFLLKDMKKAVDRINKAVDKNETICIYGDYDVDGVTSTAILLTYFRNIGYDNIMHHIPERKTEGYGLNMDAVRMISEKGCSLLVTVDCGIASSEEIKYANSMRMDVIVTDHHKTPVNLPDAYAIVNPKRDDCEFGFKELAGAGIAFKLVQALSSENDDLNSYIELSALGTVADVVPLLDENRIIVKKGLEVISSSENPGLVALKAVSGLSEKPINAGNIAFMLAPRINAAGRMGSADKALELLMSRDSEQAERLAGFLNEMNTERKEIEEKIYSEAEALIKEKTLNKQNIMVLGKVGWDSGIIGIVASKLSEKYCRPIIMIAIGESIGKASCRSYGLINLYDLLDSCRSYFIKFGGHKQAAGFSIAALDIDAFARDLEALAMEKITEAELAPRLGVDCIIDTRKIDFKLIDDIDRLAPFGCGNARPKFLLRNLRLNNFRYVGKNQKHLKAAFSESNRIFDAIGFNMDVYASFLKRKQSMDVVFNLEKNVFRNVESIQLNLKDIRINEIAYYAEGVLGRRYLKAFPLFFEKIQVKDNLPEGRGKVSGKEFIPAMLLEEGTLVAVYTLDGLHKLIGQMEEQLPRDVYSVETVFFGDEEPLNGVSHIAVLPDLHAAAKRGYKKIVNYDGYGMVGVTDYLDVSEPGDKDAFDKMVCEMIPCRSHLADIYRFLMKNGPASQWDLEKSLEVPFLKLNASLWILKDCELINYKEGVYDVHEVPEEKVDIFENNLLKKMNEYL